MRRVISGTFIAIACGLLFCSMAGAQSWSQGDDGLRHARVNEAVLAQQRFKAENAGAAVYRSNGQVRRVFGRAFANGPTAEASAEQFIDAHAEMFGVARENLLPVGPFPDGRHVQPIMYDRQADDYRFTGLYYTQVQDGIPVFRSRLTLLVRNEADHPLVLASVDLRDLGNFRVPMQARGMVDVEAGRQVIRRQVAEDADFGAPELVIWAGLDNEPADPHLAVKQLVEAGTVAQPETYQKWLYLVDAFTGEVLYRENQILHGTGVDGTVSCLCTAGIGADICHDVEARPMPYARVTAGSEVTFADAEGNFWLPDVGPGPVAVESAVRGLYFRVFNQAGSNSVLSETVTAPDTVDFLHNAANSNELTRAEVNAYYYSNIVRDFALTYNPAYPVIADQTEFTVNVNINNSCNAFYNGSSINFFTSGGGCPNTAFATVVYHEYGHHLVGTAGSGQGQYGEGMSDTVAVLITEDPILGLGFQNDCSQGIRTADNNIQYPCDNGIHFCGQVLSGCVWDTLLELQATHPDSYMDIISNLTINSILLHTGTMIDPTITIDFLTLDDDDDNIFNGTPHYDQIQAGFSAHNMPGPELDPVDFHYPDGLPDIVSPGQAVSFVMEVLPVTGQPEPGTGQLHYRFDDSGPFTIVELDEISPNVYEVTLPAIDECASVLQYYLSAETAAGEPATSPRMAPFDVFYALGADVFVPVFVDDFDKDLGWTVGAPDDDATTGIWERADPVGTWVGFEQVQPDAPYVGSACYITGQHPGGGAGVNDVDHGKTTLFSPIFDLSDADDAMISYVRWYSNHAGANPFNDIFEVDISNDGGLTWVNVETVGPSGPQVMGGWFHHEFFVSDFVDLTGEVQMRFVASDYDPQALVEAAVDAFRLEVIECEEDTCPADLTGDGMVGLGDLLALVGAWGSCPGCAEDLNGDGEVNVVDLLILIDAWGECP